MVPSQKASMSWSGTPAEAAASVAASMSRSSTPLSHNSPKRVHPMPMMATWSRIPLLAIGSLSSLGGRTGLPEVIVHALRRPHAAERHGDPVADGQLGRHDVSHLTAIAAAAVEVDDDTDYWR